MKLALSVGAAALLVCGAAAAQQPDLYPGYTPPPPIRGASQAAPKYPTPPKSPEFPKPAPFKPFEGQHFDGAPNKAGHPGKPKNPATGVPLVDGR